jgi:hypothetical protein
MALHHELPIYKSAYDLLGMALEVTRNIPRDFKRLIGEEVRTECVHLMTLIFRANVSRDKGLHLDQLLEHVQVIELLLRVSQDKHWISKKQYAAAIEITQSIGRQASGWKKKPGANASPAA